MRRFNLVFCAILLAVVTVCSGAVYLMHEYQMQKNAEVLLQRARRAEAANEPVKAAQLLREYLNIKSQDGNVWAWYARVVDQTFAHVSKRRREGVFLIFEEALRHNPGDSKVERRCAEIALELKRYSDAERHLTSLVKHVAGDVAEGQPVAAELAELEDLLGQTARGLNRFQRTEEGEGAEDWFRKAIQHDPRRVSSYDRLARLYRTNLRTFAAADSVVKEMVANNPKVAMAYVYRWRYFEEFGRPAAVSEPQRAKPQSDAAADVQAALNLAPEDPEVLWTAAYVAEQKAETAKAQAYFEKGFKNEPKNVALALGLARLETREGLARLETRERHLKRAEEILRQTIKVKPVVFMLAENLILQDKIDGKEEASFWIAVLEDARRNADLDDVPDLESTIRYLEAFIPFHRKQWDEAKKKIEIARALSGSNPELLVQLDLMLAECYRRAGDDEQWLESLRRANEVDRGPDSGRKLALALESSGKVDQAVTVLMPLAVRKPEWRLDLVRLLLKKAIRQPKDQRNWQDVERNLIEAEKALPESAEALALLRLDMLAAQNRLDAAQTHLSSVRAKAPQNLRYRLALARLTQRQGKSAAALQIIDQAQKDLGPSQEIQLARVEYWGLEGGAAAKAALAKLAETRQQIAADDRPEFLYQLGAAEIRLGEQDLGRQHWRELAALQRNNLIVRIALFDAAVAAGDHATATSLVDEIRKVEGDEGSAWRFAQATLVIDQVRRGSKEKLKKARSLASKICEKHPRSPNSFALRGQIADLAGSRDEAIENYLRAVELGNVQPTVVRRLVGLLNERNQFDDIEHVSQVLRNQGAALDDVTIVKALDAIRKQDFDRGIALARQVFSDTSTNASDHLTLGGIYMTAGRSDAAGKEFRRALDLAPGAPEAWLNYVRYLVQTRQIDQARAAIEAARKALAADRATLTLAECALLIGDAKQAGVLIERAMGDEGRSADPAVLRLAVTAALSQNRHEQAREFLDKLDQVANLSSADRFWRNRTRAALLLSTGSRTDADEALRLIDENLRNDPESVEDLGLRATILARRPNRSGQAVTILERLAAGNRLRDNERFLLAQLYLVQRDEKEYQDEMLKLLNQKVRNPQHLAQFVNYWIGRNLLDSADRWLAELKKAEPQGTRALELEARLLDLRKRKPELLALLEVRGREVPDQIGNVADLLDRYGFAKEAEEAYKAFVARDPRQPERGLVLAQFLARKDRVVEAMAILKKAWSTCRPDQVATVALLLYDAPSAGDGEKRQIEIWVLEAARKRPDSIRLACKLGVLRIRQGRFDEAEGLFRRLLASDPNDAEALNNLAWLLALRDESKAKEALTLINRAVDVQGPLSSLIDTRAVVLIRAGQLDQALKELGDARARDPRNPSLSLHLAWVLQKKGNSQEAKTALLKADECGLKNHGLDPLEGAIVLKLRHDLFPG